MLWAERLDYGLELVLWIEHVRALPLSELEISPYPNYIQPYNFSKTTLIGLIGATIT